MCLDEVDCDLKYSGLRRESHGRSMTSCHHGTCMSIYIVIASYYEDFDRRKCPWCNEKTGYFRRKIRVNELIRGSLSIKLRMGQ
jgi:hypothetical protein